MYRLVLADDALVELFFHREQLVALALHHFRDGDAGRARHDFGDFLRPDLSAEQFRLCLRRRSLLCLLQLRFELRDAPVLELGDFLPVAFALRPLHLELQLFQLFLDVLRARYLRLLRLPDFLQIGVFALELLYFALDQRQAFLRGFVLLLLYRFALDLELDNAPIEPVHGLGLGIDLHLDARRGLVDQVDGLVGQKTVGYVAV